MGTGIIIYLLILLVVAVIANYIIDQLALPPNIGWAVKLVLGVIVLVLLLQALLPMVPGGPLLRC